MPRRPSFKLLLALALTAMIGAVLLVSAAAPARAADAAAFEAAVTALDQKSFGDKAKAVDALAALGDARTPQVLRALSAGQLVRHKETGRILIAAGGTLTDAATGEAVGPADGAPLAKIVANNQIRTQIEAALGAFLLFSENPAERITAARQVLGNPTPEAAPALVRALDAETDAGAREALTRALAAVQLLGGGTAAERLAAVETLSDTNDPALKALLTTAAANDPDAAVREAAGDAVKAIDTRMAVLEVGQNLIFGLSAGSILLLAAIGLAITFGVMGVINMAHGEMLMLGAYTTFVVQEVFRATLPPSVFGLYLVVAIPAAFVVTGAVGVAMERGIIRFLYGRPLETLLATWGISLILQQAVRSLFGATNREVANPEWMSGSLELLGLSLTANRIVIILFAFAVLGGLAAFLRWSSMGLNMRAVTQNRRMASAMGIPTGRVDALTFGLGSGIAGVAGVAISQVANVSPNLGQGYIVDSFMVVVFGGVGSLWGALAGAFSLGVVNKFLEPMAGAMLGKILVLVFIILFIQKRPRGLFALRGRAFEN
ncbi:urea ABC transporter permease subunit UrtB [Caenispirillum bisanense]|uniref:Amino acid/amide ABC transporter membrane protein 1, HAAT family n=1 Tax=Caenispirillum bisanense TaxID=414052 RepID=A0A286GZ23_9PROT|nr:urea ABC transporter permease subunit UrtB [Caenispirillum bisanense]SOE00324.1 amino acid/amide ABC transporter membrane protein 1, HAAT family [Caenispirillum bisanense]